MADDLTEARRADRGAQQPRAAAARRALRSPRRRRRAPRHAFVATSFAGAARRRRGRRPGGRARARPRPPLAGLAVSIKDLFDVAGETTAAGSTILRDAPPAARRRAGRRPPARAPAPRSIGRTNMSEFAFSGVGINPHFPARSPTRRRSRSTRRRASPAARPRAARRRSPPAPPGPRSAPTPAARSAFRRRCRAWSASRAPRGWCRPTGAVPLSTDARHRLRDDALGARRGARCTRCSPSARGALQRRPLRRAGASPCRARSCSTASTAPSPRAFERSPGDAARRRRARSRRSSWRRSAELAVDQRQRRLLGGRELGLASPLAGDAAKPTTTRASRCASGAARR